MTNSQLAIVRRIHKAGGVYLRGISPEAEELIASGHLEVEDGIVEIVYVSLTGAHEMTANSTTEELTV